jgi:hypothetical protein
MGGECKSNARIETVFLLVLVLVLTWFQYVSLVKKLATRQPLSAERTDPKG